MMSIPTTSTLGAARSHTERARKHKDGSVLLSLSEDRICKLNGVGALTWMILEDSINSLTLDEIVAALQQQFDAINLEGELRYEVSTEQLRTDTERFLNKMATMNLLHTSQDVRECASYSIKEDVSGTTSADANESSLIKPSFGVDEDIEPSRRETFSAFLGLLAFDLLLKFAGFHSLIKRVERWPTAEPRRADLGTCRRVRAAVDRAQMYYPKKAMCLQHSAVVTCLLRRRGILARMVLAAQEFPAKAHAWSEAMNEVVSDSPAVKTKYRELRRL
ncbi:MAG TPA: lasso peptide biosynthesis B2 protein [Pyrinomonadaceae bacterium]|nr:lasso peptide biosynthesis B2 protein [Pyrinomonadaceae bacterium]